jgi:filamentous hemagglutinin family protein
MKSHPDYSSRFRILKGGKISLVVSALLGSVTILSASPSGGTVTSGSVTIGQNGTTTNITQSSNKATINWHNFSIGANETVNFAQPNVNSIALNRVVGNEKSIINGALNANGQVWILNSNGVLFNSTASINTAGLVATTKNISDADFNAGNYTFKGESTESVINMGTINITDGGYASLLANRVSNEGTITAIRGKVTLTGAEEVTINLNGNSLVNLTVNKGVLDALVDNRGAIIADGGEIYLTTNAVDELLKGIVNNSGIIEANSLDDVIGHVELFAHGGGVQVGGTIEAKDGFVETSGREFAIQPNATIKAGEWLIDPLNITIDSTLAETIQTALGSGDVIITTSGSNTPSTAAGESGSDGDIFVNSAITWNSANDLTLNAYRNIAINANITATDLGAKLSLYYGQGSANGGTTDNYTISSGKSISLKDGLNFSTRKGTTVGNLKDYTVINSKENLQAVNTNTTTLSGNYALGSNIDLSDVTWTPIGNSTTKFTGKFDGLGHTIDKLTINNSLSKDKDIGLFGYTNSSATIRNIGLSNVNITGGTWNVGGLVGTNFGAISNSYVGASINGADRVGGLVGLNIGIITNAYATGSVSGSNYVGGLIGWNDGGTISNTYATGSVSGSVSGSGGLIGLNYGGKISNSYATGSVSGNVDVGGLIGLNEDGIFSNSFWNTETSGVSMSSGGTGKTTADLKTFNLFNTATWSIVGDDTIDQNYPTLTMAASGAVWTIGTKVAGPTAEEIAAALAAKQAADAAAALAAKQAADAAAALAAKQAADAAAALAAKQAADEAAA